MSRNLSWKSSVRSPVIENTGRALVRKNKQASLQLTKANPWTESILIRPIRIAEAIARIIDGIRARTNALSTHEMTVPAEISTSLRDAPISMNRYALAIGSRTPEFRLRSIDYERIHV
jgi:hypothetical protein